MYRVDPEPGEVAAGSVPPQQLPRVAAANRWLERLWRAGLLPEPSLDEDALIAAAGGIHPDDTGWWREPLRLLLQDLSDTAALNPLGRMIAHGQIVKVLRERRRAHALWRAHPEILQRPIPAPVIVLGPMRSGTTRIQRLLACDPRFAHTRMFESVSPVPIASVQGRSDTRRVRAAAGLKLLHMLNPDLAAVHPTSSTAAEEEFGLYNFSFGPAQFEAQWRVPRFTAWWEAADMRPLYAEFRRLLQTISWHRDDDSERPWLLKAPQFTQDLDAVLDTFPDARLLCLDRPLEAVVPSSASLVWHQMRIQSDRSDKGWIGREWLRKTRLRRARTDIILAKRPEVPRLNISFDAVNRDWRGEMARIYGFLDLQLTSQVEHRMAAYMARAQSHLGHRYSAAEFGLSEEVLSSLSRAEAPAAPPPRQLHRAASAHRDQPDRMLDHPPIPAAAESR